MHKIYKTQKGETIELKTGSQPHLYTVKLLNANKTFYNLTAKEAQDKVNQGHDVKDRRVHNG